MNSRIVLNMSLILSFLILFFAGSCRNPENTASVKDGILGIEVPIGSGRVKKDAPYLVVGVYEESPAYKAGIRPDDIILQIDGIDLTGMEHESIFKNLLQGKAGSKISFLIQRKDKTMIIEAVRAKKAKD